jgi:transposase
MMGVQAASAQLFYDFCLNDHVPSDHLLRSIDGHLDFEGLRQTLKPFYSQIGRPSIDPELMIRMLIVGYCMGIRSERRLCEEVHLNLAYRWFCRLGLDGNVPDHSTFSKNRHGRFRESDQRYDNAYLFGAICPARGVGAALALPYADADMMQLHLDEISRNVAVGAHAVLLLDRAGWHTTGKLNVPDNITPIFLPSRAPELNPVENVWQYLRQNWLSNTVFENYDAIVDAACAAWRKLIAQPQTITSIGMRDWAHVGQPL